MQSFDFRVLKREEKAGTQTQIPIQLKLEISRRFLDGTAGSASRLPLLSGEFTESSQ
ncbi:hypothetical protein [uncultured Acidaminococcus sp.]|uniref:hypothetical protein n=1 Tax=uncultured Acidaminococcus sp. TaxID=352152 RepID=UPI002675B8AF|nr:hypothetical protein [uncultured Acidaminococcus sp.]